MSATSELDRVTMVVLRYMRPPVFVLIIVYAIGITGMALIPGKDADGNIEYMSLFHAFYFFTYTATTTGFGEIPSEFTDEQRLWAIFCLYMGVIAWLYAIGSIIRLLQNPHLSLAVKEQRFARAVRLIKQPFFIICGFGDTGSLLARGLSDNWFAAVVLDTDPERIKALALRDYNVKMPGLCADPAVPKHLIDAGVQLSNCNALVVLTNNSDVNIQISVMARFLNPDLQILTLCTSKQHTNHLRQVGNITVINPFEIFAQLLSLAIAAPRLHNLNSCLVKVKGVKLGSPLYVPTGEWIICGYGRMGKWLNQYLIRHDISTVIIDPDVDSVPGTSKVIRAHANRQTLEEAGIDRAAGVIAGTDSDHANLNILMCVQSLQPGAFTIVRQNQHENQVAFDAARTGLILQSSLTTARRILKHLISPYIQILIDYLSDRGEDVTHALVERIQHAVGAQQPHLWRINLCKAEAIAATDYMQDKTLGLTLEEILRNPYDRKSSIPVVPLAIERNGKCIMLPSMQEGLYSCDEILLCGTEYGETLLAATLNNPYTLSYLVTGKDAPRGYVFKWIEKRGLFSANH